jgi:pimeloyl-ACP methyl ester carboxylesterase
MGAYADLQHGRVWYEEQGSGPPLVLIHGGAVDSRFFDKNIGPLGEHLRVIAVDLWGHGRSPDREGRFTLESFSMDVAEIIDGVAGGPAHVLGHSIGAAVGLDLVLRRPDLVQKLIQASGGFDISADAQAAIDIDRMVEQTVAFLGSTYGQVSPDGEAHFSTVVRKDSSSPRGSRSTRTPKSAASSSRRWSWSPTTTSRHSSIRSTSIAHSRTASW